MRIQVDENSDLYQEMKSTRNGKQSSKYITFLFLNMFKDNLLLKDKVIKMDVGNFINV